MLPETLDVEEILYGSHRRERAPAFPLAIALDRDQLGILPKVVRLYKEDLLMPTGLIKECVVAGMDLGQVIDPTRPGWSYLPSAMRRCIGDESETLSSFWLTHDQWAILSEHFLPRAEIEYPAEAGGQINIRALAKKISDQLCVD